MILKMMYFWCTTNFFLSFHMYISVTYNNKNNTNNDIVVVNKCKREIRIVEIAIPGDARVC